MNIKKRMNIKKVHYIQYKKSMNIKKRMNIKKVHYIQYKKVYEYKKVYKYIKKTFKKRASQFFKKVRYIKRSLY